MTMLIDLILLLLSGLLFVPVATLFAEVAASLCHRSRRNAPEAPDCPPFAILVPAHDEEKLISATVRALVAQVRPLDRVLIVADNCSDNTAAIARSSGAEVIERGDAERRGKGFALEYGVAFLAQGKPPSAVVFIDADCRVANGGLLRLAARAIDRNGPVQGRNLSLAPVRDGVRKKRGLGARISEFAVRMKNHVRPLGCLQLGIPCPITGTGMAVPWGRLQAITLGSATLAEDLVLGVDLALTGKPAQFCPDVVITSLLPASETGQTRQRTRWEQGYLLAMRQCVPKILARAVRTRDGKLLGLALDLAILPLSLLVALNGALTGLGLVWFLFSGSAAPVLLQVGSLAVLGGTIMIVWHRHGRDLLSASDLLFAPIYMARKIPIYAGILTGRTIGWVRSDRG